MESNLNWELQFPDAILSVEELLASGSFDATQKSKIKIALENGFLNWSDYKQWASNFYGKPTLDKADSDQIATLRKKYAKTIASQSELPFWGQELIPLSQWDDQLIVLGVEYPEQLLQEIPNAIFVFCSPEILSLIIGDSQNASALTFSELLPAKDSSNETQIWQNIKNNHEDFSLIARRKFDAYIVLRVTADQKTELYKMDEDLEKEEINRSIFVYNLKEDNPFANVYQNHFTETFNLNQLNLKLLDFKYACISAIKLGPKVVGFLVGFKTTHLSQDDITTLESISEKAV